MNGKSMYDEHYYCSTCAKWIPRTDVGDNYHCPICGFKVRFSVRNKKGTSRTRAA